MMLAGSSVLSYGIIWAKFPPGGLDELSSWRRGADRLLVSI